MVNKKLFKLLSTLIVTFSVLLTSCNSSQGSNSGNSSNNGGEGSSNTSHEHTFDDKWEYNDTYHWHSSTCGHDVKANEERHNFTSTVTDPTYEEGGYTTYTCSTCGYSYADNKTDPLFITITRKNYDGTILEVDNNVSYGTTPTYEGATPIKESDGRYKYTFAGWTPEVVIATKDATYTAVFSEEKITYTIDFDLNGGASSSYKGLIEVATFSKDIFFFDCVKEDWQFRGWEYSGEKIFDEKGNQLKNVTLVDKMIFKAIYSQTVKLDITTNMPEAGTITGEGEYPYNTYVDVSVAPNQGYKFVGWYYQNTLLSNEEAYKYMMWDKDVTIEARFGKEDFNLRIYTNNEDYGLVLWKFNSVVNEYKPEYAGLQEHDSEVTIAAYSKSDVRFLGWYDENNNLVTTNAVYTFIMPNYDYTLEAKWNYFTINYNLNGGTNDPNNPNHYSIDDGIINLQDPTKEGYEFVAWKYNDEIIDAIDVNLVQDITLKAIWSPYEYEIKEDDNGKYAVIIGYDYWITDAIIPENIILSGEEIPVKEISQTAFKGNQKVKSITVSNKVTTIDEYTFAGCTALESIYIPDSVTTIGSSAFEGCTSLTSIYIPNSVTTIEDNAFYECSNLTTVTISENSQLISIGSSAFEGCSSLTSIYIPDSVTTIGSRAFYFCSKLTIYCEASSKPSGWDSNWNYYSRTVVWNCISSFEISDEGLHFVVVLDENGDKYITIAGYSGSSTNVVIPSSINVNGEDIPVKVIADNAFKDNNTITSVTISDSVTTIEDNAFFNCSNLTTVTISENSQLTTIDSYAFDGCSSLTSIYIPNSVITIGRSAFSGCSNLTTVTISENSQLTTIDSYAFDECSSLTSIYIPDSVTTIEDKAFYECSNLTTVTISENSQLISIGSSAFEGCFSLTSIYIPDSVTTIGSGAFYSCSKLTIYCEASSKPSGWSSSWNDSDRPAVRNSYLGIHDTLDGLEYAVCTDDEGNKCITISGFNGSSTNVVIPSSINVNGEDLPVKVIADNAFKDNNTITSVTISDSVTTIEDNAFYNCSNLTTVTISENSQLTAIGERAFYSCSNLTTVTISENSQLISIGSSAFEGCSSLTSIYIPDSVTTIGSGAFYSCSKLTIYCEASSEPSGRDSSWSYRPVVWNCISSFEISDEGLRFVAALDKNGDKYITIVGYTGSSTNIVIPSTINVNGEDISVKVIADNAFKDNNTIKSVTISDSVTTIEDNAFYNCSNLTTVIISENSQLITIGNSAFYNCSSLTSIYIPDSVTTIGDYAFRDCSKLTTVTISENSQLITIGYSAFYNCSSLTSIYIPDSVTTIENNAFYNCSNLTTVTIGGDSQLTSINYYAFYNCSSLTSIFIPSSVATIGDCAFRNCSNLTIYCGVDSKKEGWSNYWNYSDCPVIWNSYKAIYGNLDAFEYIAYHDSEGNPYIVITRYNGSNTDVVIPEYIEVNGEQIVVKAIADNAFYKNDTIKSVTIPNSVTTIGDYAFSDCSNLATVTISENSQLISIGSSAFEGCSSLTSIFIPDSVTTIGDYAFRDCSKLTTVTISENSQLTSINYYAFYNCSSLTSIFIPNSVTTIGRGAFYNCSNLTTVTFGENSQLTTIESFAFFSCSNLTTVTISENSQLTTIGEHAFRYCSSLISIYIPDSVTTIGSSAFYNCSNLTIYCEASSKPCGWSSSWTNSDRPAVWNSYLGIHDTLDGLEYAVCIDDEGNKYITISGYNGSNTDVVIPEYIEVNGEQIVVKKISNSAFKYNTKITSIYIPDSVTIIREYAFYNCSNLTIYCEASSEPSGRDSSWSYRPVVWSCTYDEYLEAIS